MQCLDFLEEVMESGIYSVGLKMAICVSYILLCENPVLSEYVKIIELFTKKENLSMNIKTKLPPTGKYYTDLSILSTSSYCNMGPISHYIPPQCKIMCTHERIMEDIF